jgi:hypothetical protein
VNLAAVLERERLAHGRPFVAAPPRRRRQPAALAARRGEDARHLPEQGINEVCAHLDAIAEIFVRYKQARHRPEARRSTSWPRSAPLVDTPAR